MTTAEKITVGIALLGALGVGALVPLLVGHLLGRREKKVNIADKSVQIAEAMMTRMEGELSRTLDALATTQKEGEELRAELANTAAGYSARELELSDQLRRANEELARARAFIETMQEVNSQLKAARAEYSRKQALAAAGEYPSRREPPPVDEKVWAEMVRQHEDDEYRHGRG